MTDIICQPSSDATFRHHARFPYAQEFEEQQTRNKGAVYETVFDSLRAHGLTSKQRIYMCGLVVLAGFLHCALSAKDIALSGRLMDPKGGLCPSVDLIGLPISYCIGVMIAILTWFALNLLPIWAPARSTAFLHYSLFRFLRRSMLEW